MGLANVVSLIALIILGTTDAFIILIVRCLLASLFGGNVSALMYSVPAGIAALSVQTLLYRFAFPRASLLSISFTGAVVHNSVQLAVASIIVRVNLIAVLPLMLVASAAAGVFVGVAAWAVVKYLPKSIYLT
jgi:heptaprenyl diphosphate synthase